MGRPRLLLIDDSESFRRAMAGALAREFIVDQAETEAEARRRLVPPPDAVLLDLRLDNADVENAGSMRLLQEIRQQCPSVAVLMVTAYGDVETAVECMRLGAADFIQKGSDLRELKLRIRRALEHARLSARVEQLEQELAIVEPRSLVGASEALHHVKEMIAAVAADGQVTVLLTGETGTGKELVARAIHASGPRAGGPFVPVTIAALPASTLESELFGFEPGAFTDAQRRHVGYVERSHGGVLLLDEVGELPGDIQVKLLRFLEERVVTRLGGREVIAVDAQVIAATNADLSAMIQDGRFRQDLYYRLKVCEIRLVPLRERQGDVPILVEHFLDKLGARARGVQGVDQAVQDALQAWNWPGNVRELRNVIEASLLKASLHRHRQIQLEDVPGDIWHSSAGSPVAVIQTGPVNLSEALARAELAAIERALEQAGGRKSEAGQLLGLNDRFALRRRVLRITREHPAILDEYKQVVAAFGPRGQRQVKISSIE